MEKIGLIAGNRRFPLFFAQAAKRHGQYIVAIAIRGETIAALKNSVDKLYWLSLKDFQRMFEIFKREGIDKVVMAGQISPRRLFSKEVKESPKLNELLERLGDKRADTIFGGIAEELQKQGLTLIASTTFMEEFLPLKGTLTKKGPDFGTWEDIYFGFDLAKAVALLDIGQTVAVKNKAIVAVEALEGTDNLIRRSSRVACAGLTIVKVSKPKQDLRFDIPVVGLNTVKNLIRAKVNCLAIEAEKTLFLDKAASLALADKKGLCIVAV